MKDMTKWKYAINLVCNCVLKKLCAHKFLCKILITKYILNIGKEIEISIKKPSEPIYESDTTVLCTFEYNSEFPHHIQPQDWSQLEYDIFHVCLNMSNMLYCHVYWEKTNKNLKIN